MQKEWLLNHYLFIAFIDKNYDFFKGNRDYPNDIYNNLFDLTTKQLREW